MDSDPLCDYREQRVTLLHVLSRSHCENSVTPYAVHILRPHAAGALLLAFLAPGPASSLKSQRAWTLSPAWVPST